MKSINHVILSVDEKAAYMNGSFFIRADLGMVYDNIVQVGKVVSCPDDIGVEKDDILVFHHLLVDDHLSNIVQEEFNWDFSQVEGKAYVCPRYSNGHSFKNRLLAKEKDGKVEPLFNFSYVRERINEPDTFLIVPDSAKKPERNLCDVIESATGRTGTLIIKKDSGYPIKEGDQEQFITENAILGTYEENSVKPEEGITFIEPLDEGGYEDIGGILLKKKQKSISKKLAHGRIIDSTSPELKKGEEVLYQKGATWNRVVIDGIEPFWAVSNDSIECKL